MAIVGASIITKMGKPLLARVFVPGMTKARLDGLLVMFVKLVTSEQSQRQHSFLETDSVRYLFQPIDNIYVVLITTKVSNILKDLETLRVFASVIPEYCRRINEVEIQRNVFDLLFAFDQIVTLGYREDVNVAQVRAIADMDSFEEKAFNDIRRAQEKAAIEVMRQKVHEIEERKEERRARACGLPVPRATISRERFESSSTCPVITVEVVPDKPASRPTTPSQSRSHGKALKLGRRCESSEQFLVRLRNEGQSVEPIRRHSSTSLSGDDFLAAVRPGSRHSVHINMEEKISAVVSRSGGLESGEVLGNMSVLIADERHTIVSLQISNNDELEALFRVHPCIDKKEWRERRILRPKSAQKAFPVGQEVDVLKWKILPLCETDLPITLDCWPNEIVNGCSVSVEYVLQAQDTTLNNLIVTIPLPPATAPVVSSCEGQYKYVKSKSHLVWTVDLVDQSNRMGTLEFCTSAGQRDQFFPVTVHFASSDLLCKLAVKSVQYAGSSEIIEYSTETNLSTRKFEIV